MTDLTARQLAERIADAVLDAEAMYSPPEEAVLRVLRETGHQIVKVVQDEQGVIDGDAPHADLPVEVQLPLGGEWVDGKP